MQRHAIFLLGTIMTQRRFDQKIVWITGASSGIGRATAAAFAKEGAFVIISARRETVLQEVAQEIGEDGTFIVPLNVADKTARAQAVAQATAWKGRIDILINNAGISQRSKAVDTSEEASRKVMDVNFFGPVELTRAVLPAMLKRRSGHIVTVSSVTGYVATPMRSTYAASKHAIQGYFNALEAELYDSGVDVSLIVPGYIATNITKAAVTADGSPLGYNQSDTENGMSPDACARQIVDAVYKKKRETLIGGPEIYGVYLKRFAPALMARIARKAIPK